MIQLTREDLGHGPSRIGAQPIALAGATLIVILAAVASIALWRAHSGASPELERALLARQLEARAARMSEQLVEKTKGLEVTQQESIDQLQMVQDQLQEMRKQLAAQQTDAKRLSDQITTLTEALDGLRQSFASAQGPEPPASAPSRHRTLRTRAHAARSSQGPGKSRG